MFKTTLKKRIFQAKLFEITYLKEKSILMLMTDITENLKIS